MHSWDEQSWVCGLRQAKPVEPSLPKQLILPLTLPVELDDWNMKAFYRILQPAFFTSQPMLCWSLWQQLHSQADLIIVHNCSQSILSQIIEDGAQSQTVVMCNGTAIGCLPAKDKSLGNATLSLQQSASVTSASSPQWDVFTQMVLGGKGPPGNPIGCSPFHTVQTPIHWPLNIDGGSLYETANSS